MFTNRFRILLILFYFVSILRCRRSKHWNSLDPHCTRKSLSSLVTTSESLTSHYLDLSIFTTKLIPVLHCTTRITTFNSLPILKSAFISTTLHWWLSMPLATPLSAEPTVCNANKFKQSYLGREALHAIIASSCLEIPLYPVFKDSLLKGSVFSSHLHTTVTSTCALVNWFSTHSTTTLYKVDVPFQFES